MELIDETGARARARERSTDRPVSARVALFVVSMVLYATAIAWLTLGDGDQAHAAVDPRTRADAHAVALRQCVEALREGPPVGAAWNGSIWDGFEQLRR